MSPVLFKCKWPIDYDYCLSHVCILLLFEKSMRHPASLGSGGETYVPSLNCKTPSFRILLRRKACQYVTIVCHCCCISNPSFCVILSPFQLSLVRILPSNYFLLDLINNKLRIMRPKHITPHHHEYLCDL